MSSETRPILDRLWTPWRMEYIAGDKQGGCVFCAVVADTHDRENLLLYRGDHCFIILNLYPYNSGHLMIAPYQHTADIRALDSESMLEMSLLLQRGTTLLERVLKPEGYNAGMNLGKVAGAGIVDHLHLHLVPRWGGDTNFMPVLAETRVIPELLATTYDRLKAAISAGEW